jgi:hypothetical protein
MIFRGFGQSNATGFYLTAPQFSSLLSGEQGVVLNALGISAPAGPAGTNAITSAVPTTPITASMFLSFPVSLQFDILNVIGSTAGQAAALSVLTPAQIAALDPTIQAAYGPAITLALNPPGITPVTSGSVIPPSTPVPPASSCSFWQTQDATTGACDTNYILVGGIALALFLLFGMHGK